MIDLVLLVLLFVETSIFRLNSVNNRLVFIDCFAHSQILPCLNSSLPLFLIPFLNFTFLICVFCAFSSLPFFGQHEQLELCFGWCVQSFVCSKWSLIQQPGLCVDWCQQRPSAQNDETLDLSPGGGMDDASPIDTEVPATDTERMSGQNWPMFHQREIYLINPHVWRDKKMWEHQRLTPVCNPI